VFTVITCASGAAVRSSVRGAVVLLIHVMLDATSADNSASNETRPH
jgi:hypothetical protein